MHADGWVTAQSQERFEQLYDRYQMQNFGFTLSFLESDALDRLSAVSDYFHMPIEQMTPEILEAHIRADEANPIMESGEAWAMNITERYLQQLFPLTAERDLGNYHEGCTLVVSDAERERLPFSHIVAEQEFEANVIQAASGLSGLRDGVDVHDMEQIGSSASYFMSVLQGAHRAPVGKP